MAVLQGVSRALALVGSFARRRGGLLVAVILVMTLPALLVVPQIQINADPTSFFRRDDPAVADFRYFAANFGLSDILVLAIRGSSGARPQDIAALEARLRSSPHFTTVARRDVQKDEHITVLIAFTRESSMDPTFNREVLAEVARLLRETGVRAELTGSPVFLDEAQASVRRDIERTGIVAAVLVMVILVAVFRNPVFPLVALAPLGVGVAWCLVFARAASGSINLLVAALPATLIGIGVDYALHLWSGRIEQRDADAVRRWSRVYATAGPPLFVAMLTTVAAFLTLLLAQLDVLPAMGSAGAMGIVLTFGATALMLPVLADGCSRLGVRFRPASMAWLSRAAQSAARHRTATLAVFAIVTAPLLAAAVQLRISSDPRASDPNLPCHLLYLELAAKMDIITTPILVAVPDVAAERRVLDRIRNLVGPDKAFNRVESVSAHLDRLPGLVRGLVPTRPEALRRFPPARPFVGRDSRMCIVLFPAFDPYAGNGLERIHEAVGTVRQRNPDDVVRLSGAPLVYSRMLALARGDMVRTGVAAALAAAGVLLLLLRRLLDVAAAIIPLAGGVIWMFGGLRLAGSDLTAFNVISMPMVVGLGVDYGVHVVLRLRQSSVAETMATTGRAILAASATTAAALFTLCIADNPAAVAMGLAGGIGILSCLVWSVIFLPALLVRPNRASEESEMPPPDGPPA